MVVVSAQEASALGGVDELLVRVIVAEFNVGFLLDCRVNPAIVHTEGDEVDVLACNGSGLDGGVLFLDVRGEFGAVVSTVGLIHFSFSMFLVDLVKEGNKPTSVKIAKSRLSYSGNCA